MSNLIIAIELFPPFVVTTGYLVISAINLYILWKATQ